MVLVRLFGQTTVVDGVTVTRLSDVGGPKLRTLLEVLALDVGSPVHKDRLAELLWEGDPPASWLGTLESYVCVLRRRAGLGTGRGSVLATTSSGYLLDPDRADVDHRSVLRLATAVSSGTLAAAPARARQAFALVGGPLLADAPYASYAQQARERFRLVELGLCLRAARGALVAGDLDGALPLCHRALALDEFCDEAAELCMRALWLAGRRRDALRTYLDLRGRMLLELGDEPSTGTHELYLAVLQQGPAGSSSGPPGQQAREDLRVLLALMRQTLDVVPGMRTPVSDAALAASAVSALQP